MLNNHSAFFAKYTSGLLSLALVLTPVLIIPFSENFIVHTKSLLGVFVALLLSLFVVIRLGLGQTVTFRKSPLASAIGLFGLLALISSLTASRYPAVHLFGLGGVYISVAAIAVFGASLLPKKDYSSLVANSVATMGGLIAVTTLLQLTGYGPSWIVSQLTGLPLANTAAFNLTGSSFIAAQLMAVSVLVVVSYALKQKRINAGQLLAGVLSLIGAVLAAWVSLPGKVAAAQYVPYLANWSIALDVLRVPRSALIGVGPEYFQDAYQIFKPFYLNGTALWNTTQTIGSNVPLHLLTTMGLLGLTAWLWLTLSALFLYSKNQGWTSPSATLVVGLLLLGLAFPLNTTSLVLLAVGLSFWIAEQASTTSFSFNRQQAAKNQFLNPTTFGRVLAVIGLLAIVWIGYWQGRTIASRYLMLQSTRAVLSNQVVESYNVQRQAISYNPYLDEYRRRYAQTNLSIAAALSNKANPSEAEQQQINQLIQQSLREARAATTLRPTNTQNWQTTAVIYQNLIGVAEGADQWTVNAYLQAIETAPTDPTLRSSFGQVFFSLENYSVAAQLFDQAVSLKPDLVPVRYQLAASLRELGAIPQAVEQYQILLQLVPAGSENATQLQQELSVLEEELAELQAAAEAAAGDEGQATVTEPAANPSLFDDLGTTPEVAPATDQDQTLNDLNQLPPSPATDEEPTTGTVTPEPTQ